MNDAVVSLGVRPWSGRLDLDVVYELNERVVAAVAVRGGAVLEPAARRRAARVPVALADLRFGDVAWWLAADEPTPMPSVPDALPATLSRAVLLVAWATARHDAAVARVLFGMAPAVTARLAHTSLGEVERLAEYGAAGFRPRFIDRPAFWPALLQAAAHDDRVTLERLRMRAVQLLGGHEPDLTSSQAPSDGVSVRASVHRRAAPSRASRR